MNKEKVRVRFAPSPTGHLHIGGLRTAIFNWLFAYHHDGIFLVRIEDTDRARSKPEYEQSILESLNWMGIAPDEPIIIQSDRDNIHKELIEKLVNEGKAYRCYCLLEDLVARLGYQEHQKYDGYCKVNKPNDPMAPYVIRFNVPRDKSTISFDDLIRGRVTFDIDQFDDFIIARSDGAPTYNFVVVADDEYMGITHIIRGEDHISNTPKQIMLYEALGYTTPAFAHIPLILGPSGNRLSKRDAATSVLEYKKSGYLPNAFFNYLVRLGWAHGDQEIFTKSELIKLFTLEAVGKKGSIFDQQKLDWVNGIYIRQLNASELFDYIIHNIDSNFSKQFGNWSQEVILKLIDLYKERAKRVTDIIDGLHDLYQAPIKYDASAVEKWVSIQTVANLELLMGKLEASDFQRDTIATICKDICKEQNMKLPTLLQPIRLALTGSIESPGVFDILAILGKTESLKRIAAFITYMQK
jgi:glutamyl-tRNA synthetase